MNFSKICVGQGVLNGCIFVAVFCATYYQQYLAKPFKRGFFCDDQSISYPYHADTVTILMLICVCIISCFLTFVAGELFVFYNSGNKVPRKVSNYFINSLCLLFHCLYGFLLDYLFVVIFKHTIGRKRPHFLEVCKPDVLINGTCIHNQYITDYTCTGAERLQKDAQMSFPSGHSSIAFYFATFLFCYYHRRSKVFDKFVVVASLIKIFLLGGAGYCAFSRISDYKHHPEDILVGSFLGIIGGYYFESRTFYDEEDICEHTILNTQRSNKVTDA